MIRLRHLVLVRHGETEGQSSVRYHGANDVALSLAGRVQMQRVAAALSDVAFEAVYTSALQRTVAAARIVAPEIQAQAVRGFNEIDFGDWEGLTREEIEERDPQAYRRWIADGQAFTYPGGESVPAFRTRIVDTFRTLLPAMPQRVLIVGHKGVIATIVAELLGLSAEERWRWPVDLASIHVLVRTDPTSGSPRPRSSSGETGGAAREPEFGRPVPRQKSGRALETSKAIWRAVVVNRTDHLSE